MSRDKRLNRTQEVVGSSPVSSTTSNNFRDNNLARRPAQDFLALGFFSFSNLIVASVREAPADGGSAATQGNEFLIPTPPLPSCAPAICGAAPLPSPRIP